MRADAARACLHGLVRLLRDRRGATAAIVAVTLAALIGFTGLGVETGLWYTIKRYNQSAADVAAISGAMEKAGGGAYQTDICALAKYAAKANGFTVSGSWSCPTLSPTGATGITKCTGLTSGEMCVNDPPLFGGFAGLPNYVEVILAQQQGTFFSLLSLASPKVKIDARAVAGLKAFSTCMIALNTSGTDLKNNGNATLKLNQCSFASNSTSNKNPCSVVFNGGVTMTAAAISTAGCAKITGSSNYISPPITTNASAVADPYAGQIVYTLPGAATGNCVTQASPQPLLPGLYGTGGCKSNPPPMSFTGGTTTLCPGIFFLDGDDNQGDALVISGSGTTVKMGTQGVGGCPGNGLNGVTFIATCSTKKCNTGGGFVIGGTGSNTPTVTLSAPTTVDPISCTMASPTCIPKQILFYQPTSTADTSKGNSILAGGAGVSLNGVSYTPSTQITLQGNPTFGSCTEMISGNFVVGGTPTMNAPSNACGINSQSVSTLVLAE